MDASFTTAWPEDPLQEHGLCFRMGKDSLVQQHLGHEGPRLGLGDPRAAQQEPAPAPQQRRHVLRPGRREVPQQQAAGELADLGTHGGDTAVNQSLPRLAAQGVRRDGMVGVTSLVESSKQPIRVSSLALQKKSHCSLCLAQLIRADTHTAGNTQ